MSNPNIRNFAPVGNPNAGRHKVIAAMRKLDNQLSLKNSKDRGVRVDIGYDIKDRQWNVWITSAKTKSILASAVGRSPDQAADNLMELFPEFFNSQL